MLEAKRFRYGLNKMRGQQVAAHYLAQGAEEFLSPKTGVPEGWRRTGVK